MVRCRMLVKWLDGSLPNACLTAGRFAAECLFSGWTVRRRIRKKIIRTPFLFQSSYYSLMAERVGFEPTMRCRIPDFESGPL